LARRVGEARGCGNLDWRDIAGQYCEKFSYDDNHRLQTGKFTRLLNGRLLPEAQQITSLQHDYDKLGNVACGLCKAASRRSAKVEPGSKQSRYSKRVTSMNSQEMETAVRLGLEKGTEGIE